MKYTLRVSEKTEGAFDPTFNAFWGLYKFKSGEQREPTDQEIAKAIAKTLTFFPSTAAFESRLKQVGFTSVKDDNFEQIIAKRLSIESYIDFRFRSFVVVTPDEVSRYYRDVFVPEFTRRNSGRVVPTLEEKRDAIRAILVEERVAARIESFLDDAKRRVDVEILIEV